MDAHEAGLPWSREIGVAARAIVRDRLRAELSGERLEDVEIVVTELATNAFRHAGPLPDGGITLRIEIDEHAVWLIMIDGGADVVPSWTSPAEGQPGTGLSIVDAIATSWGISDDGANAVWAELS